MLAGAAERGADALIVDLEDAVAPQAKAAARREVAAWLDGLPPGAAVPQVWVRINPAGPDGWPVLDDVAVAAHPAVTGVLQAKCEQADDLARLDESLTGAEQRAGLAAGSLAVAILVESAAGVLALAELAAAPRVRRLGAGEADLCAALGMDPGPGRAELASLRWTLVLTSAAAGIDAPVGPVETRLHDLDALRASTEALRRQGFGGRAALHPRQVPVINEVFTPSAAEADRAAALVARFEAAVASGQGVLTDDRGAMVDEAVVRSARRVLARSRQAEGQSS